MKRELLQQILRKFRESLQITSKNLHYKKGLLCIYYNFWFCVLWCFCIANEWVSGSISVSCIYGRLFFCLFDFFPILMCLFLSYLAFYFVIIPYTSASFLMRDRKEHGSRWEEMWGAIGRNRGRKTIFRI